MKLHTLILLPLITFGAACRSSSSAEQVSDYHPTTMSEDEFKALHSPPPG